jgi:CBS domain-containing protein
VEAGGRRVSQIMRSEFISVRLKERLDFADRVLRLGHFRHLPVVEGGKLVGVLSNRDVLAAALTRVLNFGPQQRGAFLHSVEVSEVMTSEVITADPETTLREAALRMIEHKVGCLPVVEGDGKLVGIVTETDLLRAAYLTEPGE